MENLAILIIGIFLGGLVAGLMIAYCKLTEKIDDLNSRIRGMESNMSYTYRPIRYSDCYKNGYSYSNNYQAKTKEEPKEEK